MVIVYVRIRYLDIPFERDEGEYAYGAQLLLSGKPLYSNLYSLKWPGIFIFYAVIIKIFGASIWGVHFGLLVVHLLTVAVVYRICCFHFSKESSLLAAGSFMVLMVQKELQGIMANSEHFVVLFLALSLLAFFFYFKRGTILLLFFSGIFSGIAFLTKQHAIGYLLAIVLALIVYRGEKRDDKFFRNSGD